MKRRGGATRRFVSKFLHIKLCIFMHFADPLTTFFLKMLRSFLDFFVFENDHLFRF